VSSLARGNHLDDVAPYQKAVCSPRLLLLRDRARILFVGTHANRANDGAIRSSSDVGTCKDVPTISTKDTNIVSLCTIRGCAGFQGKPIAAHPRGTNKKVFPRSYANALLGRCK
jgi:hypothetical protein